MTFNWSNLVPVLFAYLLLAVFIRSYISSLLTKRRFQREATRTIGKVIGFAAKPGMRSSILFLEVEFYTAKGKRIVTTSAFGTNELQKKYAVGDTITVFYDPTRPSRNYVQIPGSWIMDLALGVILVLVGLGFGIIYPCKMLFGL